MRRIRSYSAPTAAISAAFGAEIAAGRRERRITVAELAERAGTSPSTVQRVERGDPTVAIGTVIEVGRIVGLRFFGAEPGTEAAVAEQASRRLTVLPARVRPASTEVDDDF